MIVTCPACATCYDGSEEQRPDSGMIQRCPDCGERAPEEPAVDLAATVRAYDTEILAQAETLARMRRAAAERAAVNHVQSLRELRSWLLLIGLTAAVVLGALAWPQQIVTVFPAAAGLYAKMGVGVNIRGLAFAKVGREMELTDGIPVLAVAGEVHNVTASARDVPPLHFTLRDREGQDLYTWTLPVAAGPLGPGRSLPFLTRIATPPSDARQIEIRFARGYEIGSNSGP